MAGRTFIVYIMVFVSGFTGLAYQIIWQKYLSMMLGSHASATSLVLTTFFLYLAIGYHVIGGLIKKYPGNRIKIYAWLELFIGAFALISPNLFIWLKNSYFQMAPEANVYVLGFGLASICLAFPTFLMGGTIPVLTEGLSESFGKSHSVHARVYALNTLGAFWGALCCGYIFLETWGLPLTLLGAGVANVGVFLLAFFISGRSEQQFRGPQESEQNNLSERKPPLAVYLVSALSGFYVFSLENILIRYMGIAIGSTVYAYTMIVAAFILAIAIGSFIAEKFDADDKPMRLVWAQVALLIFSVALYLSIPEWPNFYYRLRIAIAPLAVNFSVLQALYLLCTIVILMVPVGLMGMNLPLLFGYLRRNNFSLATSVGRLYAVNCFGSVLGASVGGYFLFHIMSAQKIFAISLLLIAVTILLLGTLFTGKQRLRVAALSLVTIGVGAWLLPSWQVNSFVPSRAYMAPPHQNAKDSLIYVKAQSDHQMLVDYHVDDPNTTVSVTRRKLPSSVNGKTEFQYELMVNGKADSIYPGDETVRAMLPLFATSLSPKLDQVFIVGLGAGLSTAIVANLPEVKRVEVAEISDGVIGALPFFEKFNRHWPENKSKVALHVGDAYQVLARSPNKYNLIMSEPSNPWIAGVDKLFSFEFFKLVADRLKPSGVYGMWFPVGTFDAENFYLVLATLNAVFPYVSLWNSGGNVVTALASLQPLQPEFSLLKDRFEKNKQFYYDIPVRQAATVLGLQVLPPASTRGLSATAKIHSLEHPTLTYGLARNFFSNSFSNIDEMMTQRIKRPVQGEFARFVYQDFEKEITTEVLTDILSFYSGLGKSTTQALQRRWEWMAYKGGIKNYKYGRAFDWLKVILDGGTLPEYAHTATPYQISAALYRAYGRAKVAFLQPKSDLLLKYFPKDCETPQCVSLAWHILNEIKPLDKVDTQNRPDFSQAEVQKQILREIASFQQAK